MNKKSHITFKERVESGKNSSTRIEYSKITNVSVLYPFQTLILS